MGVSPNTIDRIVANVLSQLSANNQESSVEKTEAGIESNGVGKVQIFASVVTAQLLEPVETGSVVQVAEKAIITPAAADVIREYKLIVNRGSQQSAGSKADETSQRVEKSGLSVAIVRHTAAVKQALDEIGTFKKELLGCPDDAAKFAISEVCRGEAGTVLIFAEQTYRATCLANRNSLVKAVAVGDPGDVKTVRKQLRANVWCLDPGDRSYFELRNVLKAILG